MCVIFFFKQNTAYEMRISDWSSDVCSSDLLRLLEVPMGQRGAHIWSRVPRVKGESCLPCDGPARSNAMWFCRNGRGWKSWTKARCDRRRRPRTCEWRSEEHTPELQSLMRISYAVFCLKKKNK